MTSEHSSESEIDRRLGSILERFPDRFSADDLTQIRKQIDRSIELGQKLHDCDLPNEIGPWFDPRAMTRD